MRADWSCNGEGLFSVKWKPSFFIYYLDELSSLYGMMLCEFRRGLMKSVNRFGRFDARAHTHTHTHTRFAL